MLFWSIVLVLSIIGVFSIAIFRMIRPNLGDELIERHLHKRLHNAKKLVLAHTRNIGRDLGKGALLVYDKGLARIKDTKVSGLVRGEGVLKKKDVTSNFLKDVKEHRDKVREELMNGD